MRDLAFYNAGCHEPRGARRVVVPFRRLLRRLLRPIFFRQVALFHDLHHRIDHLEHENRALRSQVEAQHVGAQIDRIDRRHDALAAQMQTTIALGWDYVATLRRLAILEDRVESLLSARDESRDSIPFPAPADTPAASPIEAAPQARVG